MALPETAIREEGTSHHYLPPDVPAKATEKLVKLLDEACRRRGLEPRLGLHWTTDAIYREHVEKIARYREKGVLSVDMEISAIYSLAACRGVDCAAVVAISDELFEPYRVGFRSPEFEHGIRTAGQAALDVATGLASRPSDAARS